MSEEWKLRKQVKQIYAKKASVGSFTNDREILMKIRKQGSRHSSSGSVLSLGSKPRLSPLSYSSSMPMSMLQGGSQSLYLGPNPLPDVHVKASVDPSTGEESDFKSGDKVTLSSTAKGMTKDVVIPPRPLSIEGRGQVQSQGEWINNLPGMSVSPLSSGAESSGTGQHQDRMGKQNKYTPSPSHTHTSNVLDMRYSS